MLVVAMGMDTAAQRKKADKDTEDWRYELEAVDVGVTGTDLIKVWSYSRNPDIAVEQSKKNAVHGIVFRGFAGSGRITGKKALVTDPAVESSKADFFKEFFADGGSRRGAMRSTMYFSDSPPVARCWNSSHVTP